MAIGCMLSDHMMIDRNGDMLEIGLLVTFRFQTMRP